MDVVSAHVWEMNLIKSATCWALRLGGATNVICEASFKTSSAQYLRAQPLMRRQCLSSLIMPLQPPSSADGCSCVCVEGGWGGDSKLPLCVVVRARPRVLCAYRRRSEHCVDLITAAKTTPTQRRRVINFSGALITLLLLSDCHYQATASCWKSLSSLLQMIKSLLTFKGLIIVLAYCFFFFVNFSSTLGMWINWSLKM